MFQKGVCIRPKECNKCCVEFGIRISKLHPDDVFRINSLDTNDIVLEDEGSGHRLILKFKCKFLTPNGCLIQETKPNSCKMYPYNESEYNRYCIDLNSSKTK